MAITERIPEDDLALGLVFMDPLLIMLQYWEGDLTMEGGYQHLSMEQRSFLCTSLLWPEDRKNPITGAGYCPGRHNPPESWHAG